jgi:hypothetical protein
VTFGLYSEDNDGVAGCIKGGLDGK